MNMISHIVVLLMRSFGGCLSQTFHLHSNKQPFETMGFLGNPQTQNIQEALIHVLNNNM